MCATPIWFKGAKWGFVGDGGPKFLRGGSRSMLGCDSLVSVFERIVEGRLPSMTEACDRLTGIKCAIDSLPGLLGETGADMSGVFGGDISKLKRPKLFVGLGCEGLEFLGADLALSCWSAPPCGVNLVERSDGRCNIGS